MTSGADQKSQIIILDMLAAATERLLERCGLEYAGMYYDANSTLFYDQVYIIISIVGGEAPNIILSNTLHKSSWSVLVG